MKVEIKSPLMPESVTEGTILTWHKKIGDFVKREEKIVDIETDKVVMEVPSTESGVLVETLFNPGDTIKSSQIIGYLDTSITQESIPIIEKVQPSNMVSNAPNIVPEKILAMPSASKIINENNIDVSNIKGTGRGGRILKEDILPTSTNINSSNKIEERVPMSRLRKKVAQRLLESQQTNAILTTFNEVDLQSIIDIRTKYKDVFEKKYGVKVGFMSFFIKAVVHALKTYPIVNAYIDGDDIVYHNYFDIGVAVGSDRGLVVPILRNAETLSLSQIELKIAEFANKAKTGTLSLEELTGGTFTVTNGGTFGSMMSTPIINPPQSAILGMHAIKERPVAINGNVVIRPMMYIALSYDHRLIDGKEAVLTLVSIKNSLEDPIRFLLDI